MTTQTATNGFAIRELKDSEIDAVNGGFIEIAAMILGTLAARAYIQWLKDNGKLPH